MLKLSDLVQRPDFRLGPLEVSPARRRVAGPAGEATVEPLVMQLLLLLIDGRGQVVTRIELFNQLWGGVMVGDERRRILAIAFMILSSPFVLEFLLSTFWD